MKSVDEIRGARCGEWSMWAEMIVPYEWATRTKRCILRESMIRLIASQVAVRERTGLVIRMLMGISSITRMPTSGSLAMSSLRKDI
jgi:hypothetical protein